MSAAESAAESAAASAAKKNLKAKKNDFHHYIRHINVYGTYVRVTFIFSTTPPPHWALELKDVILKHLLRLYHFKKPCDLLHLSKNSQGKMSMLNTYVIQYITYSFPLSFAKRCTFGLMHLLTPASQNTIFK